jgi:hypothetical protein
MPPVTTTNASNRDIALAVPITEGKRVNLLSLKDEVTEPVAIFAVVAAAELVVAAFV